MDDLRIIINASSEIQDLRSKLIQVEGKMNKMYNDEEVLQIIKQYALEEHLITSYKPDIWFEQFKKLRL